jgi:hypothetical protein
MQSLTCTLKSASKKLSWTSCPMFGRLRRPRILNSVLLPNSERVMIRRPFWCRISCMSLILSSCLLAGCAGWSPGSGSERTSWTERWKAGASEVFGVDERARQIEKNLGVE